MTTSNATPAGGPAESPSEVKQAFSEHREDGWPLCPACGEDELYSLDFPASIDTISGCYNCGWTAEEFLLGFRV